MLTITNVTAASGEDYPVVPNLRLRQQVYLDRGFIVTGLPEVLVGSTYIQTANDDKKETGTDFLGFEVNEPVTVYVGHDARIMQKPIWLSLWVDTGQALLTSDTTMRLFSKTSPAGTVILGPNGYRDKGSMYVVAVTPVTVPIEPEPPVRPTVHVSFSMVHGETTRTFSGDLTEEP